MKDTLIVLCAGKDEYRGAMLRRIAEHFTLLLVNPDPPTWEASLCADVRVVEASDTEQYVAAALDLAAKYKVAGVFTYYEWCVEIAARVAQDLGLPNCSPGAAQRCRDKWQSREALREAGVPSARSHLVTSPGEALEAAEAIGFPVIVKPRALSASFGVSIVHEPSGVDAAFEDADASPSNGSWQYQHGVLVEEYLDGPEISVDSVVVGSTAVPLVFARKLLGFEPHFEEIGHIVGPADDLVPDADAVRAVVVAAHAALGIADTLTHTELRLTSRGPRIVEVNARSGGDVISELGLLALGVDLGHATAMVAVGQAPHLTASGTGFAGVRFLYPDAPGRIERYDVPAATLTGAGFERLVWMHRPGDTIDVVPGRRYFCRLGYVITRGDSAEQCEMRLAEAARTSVVMAAAKHAGAAA